MGLEAWFALVVCIAAGSAATLAWARRTGVLLPALVGLATQGVITVGLFAAVGLWAPDAVVYDELGQEFATFWGGGPVPSEVGEGKEAFPLMLGGVYFVVGPASAIGLAMNWAAHGLLIPTLGSLAKRLDLPTRPTAWVVALFPPALFWSGFLLREAITWLLMAVFLYAVAGIARRITVRDIAIMVASLAALMWFRGTAAIILAGVGMVVLVLTAKRHTFLPRLGVAALALLVLSPRLTSLLAGYTTVGDIEAKRADLTNADTGFAPAPAAGDDGGVATSLVDSVLRVAFGPYPWEWPGLGGPFALDAVLWLTILSLAVLGWWRAANRMELLLLVLPALALSGALMLTSGNYGTMQRLRVQTSVLLIPIAAAGLSLVAVRIRGRRTTLARRAATVSTDSPR
jgi:hypothetical protein